MNATQLSASILSANFAMLGQHCDEALNAGIARIHFDVMDNHFVPNLSFGAPICLALRQHGILAPIDVHLMVTEPMERLIQDFASAGASSITFHREASNRPQEILELIHKLGLSAGIAIRPHTPLDQIIDLLPYIQNLLIMTVEPGFGGQPFIPNSLQKIRQAKALIKQYSKRCKLGVDGGINLNNIANVIAAGADTIVIGSALFNTPSLQKTCQQFMEALPQTRTE